MEQSFPVFISEYKIDDYRFFLVDEIAVGATFRASGNSIHAVEKALLRNKVAKDLIDGSN